MKTNLAFLAILIGAGLAPRAAAQSAGTFTPTGSMTAPRFYHTATLLGDGRVLIAGGQTGNGSLASAELYDPSTGTFSVTGQMTTPRVEHTATLLADGRVLIAGGADMASAELFDPTAGIFSATGSMTTPRAGHSATLLADGRVLIVSGLSAELYDPTTGTFAATGNPHHDWTDVGAALLTDGTVLVGTEVYRPSTGAFTDSGHPSHDAGSTASLLADGTALIAGGGDSDPATCIAAAELYDSTTGNFVSAGNMTICRYSHTSTLLPNGRVLIAGGASYGVGLYQANLAEFEIYDPLTRTLSASGSMTAGRQRHTATLLLDGRVLITGGIGAPGYSTLATAEIYSPLSAPVLFQGAIQHTGTSQLASSSNPAIAGEVLAVYFTGLVAGSVVPPQVAIGGRMAEVLFFGNTPGYAGLNQVNVRVPDSVVPGSAVSVRVTYLGRPSNEVSIGVQ